MRVRGSEGPEGLIGCLGNQGPGGGSTGALSAGRCDGRAKSVAERSYPTSEVSGRSREDPMPKGRRPRGVTARPRSGAEAGRTPCPKGGGQEELLHVRGRGSGQECQTATAQERRRGATLRPRSGGVA